MSYRKKNLWLLGIGMVTMLLTWQWSIKTTLQLSEECSEFKLALEDEAGILERFTNTQSEINSINEVLQKCTTSSLENENSIIATLSPYSTIQVKEISIPISKTENGYSFVVRHVILKGLFKDMLQAIHALEQKDSGGRILSLSFTKRKERGDKTESLYADFFIQNIETDENANT